MTHKNAALYRQVFECFRDDLGLVPGLLMSDFELAPRIAAKSIWREIEFGGCLFHFCQALRRKAFSMKDLSTVLSQNQTALVTLHLYMKLPLLPLKYIPAGIKAIEAYQKSHHLLDAFDSFRTYFKRSWGDPTIYCVSELQYRTNNWCESYNSLLKKRIPRNPNVYTFLSKIQELAYIAIDRCNYAEEHGVKFRQRSRIEKSLKKNLERLNEKRISILRFLRNMCPDYMINSSL